jgi:hypothetical protein
LLRFWQPFEHIVSPARQALQSVPAALHADGQVIIVVLQEPAASHIAADVRTPPVHDWSAPHDVPAGLLPLVTQSWLPVAHEVVPSLHGSDAVHAVPAMQGMQLPVLQTRFVPQLVPLGTAMPLSWQVAVPVVQVSDPVWQGLLGVQAPPAMHGRHAPLLQTRSVPHGVPFATLPVSAQTEAPVTHDVAPVRHLLAG